MFMLQTAWETTTGEKQDAWGKAVVGFMIMVANALAAGIYPLWRAGGVNLQFIKESISAVPEKLLEIPMVAEIAEIFRCCMTASDQSAGSARKRNSSLSAQANPNAEAHDQQAHGLCRRLARDMSLGFGIFWRP